MRTFTFYGLDETGAIEASTEFQAATLAEAVAFARARLAQHHMVELWEGAVRELRERRGGKA